MKKSLNFLFLLFLVLFILKTNAYGIIGFEVFGQGSYMKFYDTSKNYTITKTISGGCDLVFFKLTAIELSFTRSEQEEIMPENTLSVGVSVNTITDIASVSLLQNLTLDSFFQPYIKVGLGYLIKKSKLKIGDIESGIVKKESISTNLGGGLKLYIVQRLALEFSFTAYITGLNNHEERLINYIYTGGLRFVLF